MENGELEIQDLVPGEIYVTTNTEGYVEGLVFKSNEKNVGCPFFSGTTYYDTKEGSGGGHFHSKTNSSFKYYRKATHEEASQLRACIKAERYVPLSDVVLTPIVNNEYQII